jgi:hypothetical protein
VLPIVFYGEFAILGAFVTILIKLPKIKQKKIKKKIKKKKLLQKDVYGFGYSLLNFHPYSIPSLSKLMIFYPKRYLDIGQDASIEDLY